MGKRIKYIIWGVIFIGIGIVLANLFQNKVRLSINDLILSCVGIMLLIIAPLIARYFISRIKPSKYIVASIILSSVCYTLVILLLIFHSRLPISFEEIGILVVGIIAFAAAVLTLRSVIDTIARFIRFFKRKD